MKYKVTLVYFLSIIFLLPSCSQKEDTPVTEPVLVSAGMKEKVLVENLSFPWEILWGSDNFIWMTERGGRISRINPSTGNLVPIYTIPDVQSNGEGGLLGMAVHPNFSTNPFVYVVYNYNA
ncbi:MAG TPA: PQQ-dependent sugar dehydrogenase, partial [Chitinophagaceae bacterium]|nr:PQQ-dependent sugar dehydrogenase [Chitinophagaceae bacterium]